MKLKSIITVALIFIVSSLYAGEVFQFYESHGAHYARDLRRKKDVVGCYYPGKDKIHLLRRGDYSSEREMNQTALHELAHWARHSSRLGPFGTGNYPEDYEDIMCEISAAVIADALDLPRECNCRVSEQVRDYIGRRRFRTSQWNRIFREVHATVSYLLNETYPENELKGYFQNLGLETA